MVRASSTVHVLLQLDKLATLTGKLPLVKLCTWPSLHRSSGAAVLAGQVANGRTRDNGCQ